MLRNVISGLALIPLLMSMCILAFNVQPVKADWTWTETIYIRADGIVEPDAAPISSVDNVTYILTDNILGELDPKGRAIVVERNNIVIDGAGCILQGAGSGTGICLGEVKESPDSRNVTIKNMKIRQFEIGVSVAGGIPFDEALIMGNTITDNSQAGIRWRGGHDNVFSGNTISDNGHGIYLGTSDHFWEAPSDSNVIIRNNVSGNSQYGIKIVGSYNEILGNNIIGNGIGLGVHASYLGHGDFTDARDNIVAENTITSNTQIGIEYTDADPGYPFGICWNNFAYHNNFLKNFDQAAPGNETSNFWDNGYPSGGNYWSDYAEVDRYQGANQDILGSDGIGDIPYVIDANNTDYYPLMKPWGTPPPPPPTPVECVFPKWLLALLFVLAVLGGANLVVIVGFVLWWHCERRKK